MLICRVLYSLTRKVTLGFPIPWLSIALLTYCVSWCKSYFPCSNKNSKCSSVLSQKEFSFIVARMGVLGYFFSNLIASKIHVKGQSCCCFINLNFLLFPKFLLDWLLQYSVLLLPLVDVKYDQTTESTLQRQIVSTLDIPLIKTFLG